MGWSDPYTVTVDGDGAPASLLPPGGVKTRAEAIVVLRVPDSPPPPTP